VVGVGFDCTEKSGEVEDNAGRGWFRVATDLDKRSRIVCDAGHVGLQLALVLLDEDFTVAILDTNAETLKTNMAGRMRFIDNREVDKAENE
jgi:hypothetical protein